MARAYVRICIVPGHERKIRDNLRKLPEIVSADITAGEQDLVALVKGNSYEEILATVVQKVRTQEGMKVTWTNFILED
jgi:DNA-binding Lrp family transcriptional regulator